MNALDLKSAVSRVMPSVAKKTALPILAGIILKPHDDGRISVSGTNLESWSTIYIPGTLDAPIVLNGKQLAGALKYTTPVHNTVTIDPDGTVTTDTGSMRVDTYPVDDFPLQGTTEPANITTITADTLATLHNVGTVAAKDGSRPVLCGIAIKTKNGKTEAMAADGFRLTVAPITISGDPWNVIIPASSIAAVVKAKPLGEITVIHNDSRSVFIFQDGHVLTRTIEGTFPDAWQIVPRDVTSTVTLDTRSVTSALTAIRPAAKQHDMRVRLSIADANGTLPIRVTDKERTIASGSITCAAKPHDTAYVESICLNADFLAEIAKYAPEPLVMGMNDKAHAIRVTTGIYTHVIMPMVDSYA